MKLVAQRRRKRYNKSIEQLLARMEEDNEMVQGDANMPVRLNHLIYSRAQSSDHRRDPMARSMAVGRQNTEKEEGELILDRIRM